MNARTVQILSIAFFVGTVAWGLYVTLVYIGIPVHMSVLLTDAAQDMVHAACSGDAPVCRGISAFIPFLIRTGGRTLPFFAYICLSVLVYALYAGFRWAMLGEKRLTITWTPWKILLLFIGCLWLLFTTLSLGKDGTGRPVRSVVEPLPAVYTVSEQGLAELQNDYQSLLARGCLRQVDQTSNGARLYDLKSSCMQQAFFSRVLSQALFILFFLFELLVLGRALLRLLKVPATSLLLEAILSAGLGACGWIVFIWTLAIAGIYVRSVGVGLLIAVPVILFPHARYWVERFLRHSWMREYSFADITILLSWLLLSYLALNFLTVIRPFPIGWDDLGSYLNRPRMLVSYGSFIHSMATFQWEYLTSLGFLLFGFGSVFGATASMMINWSAGLLALLSVFVFGRTFLGERHGFLAALIFYSLPLVGHFSFADMKIDNAVFAMGGLAALCLFLGLFSLEENTNNKQEEVVSLSPWKKTAPWFVLAGIFAVFAFSMKVTAIMVLMALLAVLAGVLFHWTAFFGMSILAVAMFVQRRVLDLSGIAERISGKAVTVSPTLTMGLLSLVALGLLGFAFAKSRDRRRSGLLFGAFILAFVCGVLPWNTYNNYLRGNAVPRLETGAPDRLSPVIYIQGNDATGSTGQDVRVLPADLAIDQNHSACKATGAAEELGRYWGYGKGLSHYLTLPWRSVMNIDSGGYYVTTIPALLLFPLLLLLPYFWTKKGRWLRWLFAFTLFLVLQWIFLANGIPWYGVGMFFGLTIGLEAMIARAPDVFSRTAVSVLVTLSLLSSFCMRFWQFDMQRNILEYSVGKVSARVLEELTIPWYDDITQIALDRHAGLPDRPYLYRVGTFIPYFIPRSLEVIGLADHQLDVFNCLYQERDPQLTLKRLKALGFNSIIFDTNTATIETNEQGSLHQKVNAFVDFANAPGLGLQIVVNDTRAGVAYILLP